MSYRRPAFREAGSDSTKGVDIKRRSICRGFSRPFLHSAPTGPVVDLNTSFLFFSCEPLSMTIYSIETLLIGTYIACAVLFPS